MTEMGAVVEERERTEIRKRIVKKWRKGWERRRGEIACVCRGRGGNGR